MSRLRRFSTYEGVGKVLLNGEPICSCLYHLEESQEIITAPNADGSENEIEELRRIHGTIRPTAVVVSYVPGTTLALELEDGRRVDFAFEDGEAVAISGDFYGGK